MSDDFIPNLKTPTKIVPANGIVEVDAIADFVVNLSSGTTADSLKITLQGGGESRFDAYDKYKLPTNQTVSKFTLRNTTGSDISVVLGLGQGDISVSNSVSVSGSVATAEYQPTACVSSQTALNNGSATLIAAASTTNREIELSNNVANGVVMYYGASNVDATHGTELGIGAVLTWRKKAALYVFVTGAGKVANVNTYT